MKVGVKKLQTDISNMKSVEVELSEKDKEIQSMKQESEEMSATLQNILSVIGNVEQTKAKQELRLFPQFLRELHAIQKI